MFRKIVRKNMDVHKICLYNLQNFSFKFEKKIERKNRKIWYEWCHVSLKKKIRKLTLFRSDLSFLFLNVNFEFEAEFFRDCTNICCEHPQFFIKFCETYEFNFLDGSTLSSLRCGSTRYLLGDTSIQLIYRSY